MADEPETNEDELLLTEPLEQGADADDADDALPAAEPEEDEFAIEIEGDEPETEETPLIRSLRQELRDTQRELSQRRKVEAPKIEVGEKPDLWNDCDGDVDKYDAAVAQWNDRKAAAAKQAQDSERATEVRNQEYQRRFVNYRAKAAALPVKDYDEAEKVVVGALPELLQSAVVTYAEDPAKVVYALAKYPARLAALAQENDPIKFVLAIRDMEKKMTVKKKQPPAPEAETIQSGSAQATGSDKTAEKLLAEAQRTGDMTKYRAHMKAKRAA